VRASLQNAGNEDQFKSGDLVGDLALPRRELERFRGTCRKFAPLAAARHQVFTGGECGVEVIGEHVNRQWRMRCPQFHPQLRFASQSLGFDRSDLIRVGGASLAPNEQRECSG
jgi:hypothetical protein